MRHERQRVAAKLAAADAARKPYWIERLAWIDDAVCGQQEVEVAAVPTNVTQQAADAPAAAARAPGLTACQGCDCPVELKLSEAGATFLQYRCELHPVPPERPPSPWNIQP